MAISRLSNVCCILILSCIYHNEGARVSIKPVYERTNDSTVQYSNPYNTNSSQELTRRAHIHVRNQQQRFNLEKDRKQKAMLERSKTHGGETMDSYVKAYQEQQEGHQREMEAKLKKELPSKQSKAEVTKYRSLKDFPNAQWWLNSRQVRNKRINKDQDILNRNRLTRIVATGTNNTPYVLSPNYVYVPIQNYGENLQEFTPMFDHSFLTPQKPHNEPKSVKPTTSQRFKTEGVNALTKAALYHTQAQHNFNQLANYKGNQHVDSLNALLGKKPTDQLKGFNQLLQSGGNNHKLTYEDLTNSHINIDASSLDIKNGQAPKNYLNLNPDSETQQDNRQYSYKDFPEYFVPPIKDHTPITENVQETEDTEKPIYTVKYVYSTENPVTSSNFYNIDDHTERPKHTSVKNVNTHSDVSKNKSQLTDHKPIVIDHKFPNTNNRNKPQSQIYTYFMQNDKLLYESRITDNQTDTIINRRNDTVVDRKKRDLSNETNPYIKSKVKFETEIFITSKDFQNLTDLKAEPRIDDMNQDDPEFYYYDDDDANSTELYDDYTVESHITYPTVLNCSNSIKDSDCHQNTIDNTKMYASAYNHSVNGDIPRFESLIRYRKSRKPLYRVFRGERTRVYQPKARFRKYLIKKPKRNMPVNIFDNIKFPHLNAFLNDDNEEHLKKSPFVTNFADSGLVDSYEYGAPTGDYGEDDTYRSHIDYNDFRSDYEGEYEDGLYHEDFNEASGTEMFHRYAPYYSNFEDYSDVDSLGPMYKVPYKYRRPRPYHGYDEYIDSEEYRPSYKRKNKNKNRLHAHHSDGYGDDCISVEFISPQTSRPKLHSKNRIRNSYRGHSHRPSYHNHRPYWLDRKDPTSVSDEDIPGNEHLLNEPKLDYAHFLFNNDRQENGDNGQNYHLDKRSVYHNQFMERSHKHKRPFKFKKHKKRKPVKIVIPLRRKRTKAEKKRHVLHLQHNINKLNAKLSKLP